MLCKTNLILKCLYTGGLFEQTVNTVAVVRMRLYSCLNDLVWKFKCYWFGLVNRDPAHVMFCLSNPMSLSFSLSTFVTYFTKLRNK